MSTTSATRSAKRVVLPVLIAGSTLTGGNQAGMTLRTAPLDPVYRAAIRHIRSLDDLVRWTNGEPVKAEVRQTMGTYGTMPHDMLSDSQNRQSATMVASAATRVPDLTPMEQERIERALEDDASGRAYVIGPDDLEDYANMTASARAELHASRDALDAWLATHAAKYQ